MFVCLKSPISGGFGDIEVEGQGCLFEDELQDVNMVTDEDIEVWVDDEMRLMMMIKQGMFSLYVTKFKYGVRNFILQ